MLLKQLKTIFEMPQSQ